MCPIQITKWDEAQVTLEYTFVNNLKNITIKFGLFTCYRVYKKKKQHKNISGRPVNTFGANKGEQLCVWFGFLVILRCCLSVFF